METTHIKYTQTTQEYLYRYSEMELVKISKTKGT